jgi:hypothetical protein
VNFKSGTRGWPSSRVIQAARFKYWSTVLTGGSAPRAIAGSPKTNSAKLNEGLKLISARSVLEFITKIYPQIT